MPEWLKSDQGGVTLSLRVVPRASRNAVGEPVGASLKIRLQAPPVDGKANAALRSFLAETLGVPVRAVTLVSGETGRLKRVRVEGLTPAAVQTALSA
jgi:uncharacterized protein (TIGR00251 family)